MLSILESATLVLRANVARIAHATVFGVWPFRTVDLMSVNGPAFPTKMLARTWLLFQRVY